MKLTVLEKNLEEQIRARIQDVTPGVMVRAYQGGKQVIDVGVGDTWAYYDLASLTKVIFTVEALMVAFENRLWDEDSTLGQFVPWYPHPQLRIVDILSHSAGFTWWMPFYKDIDLNLSVEARREQLKKMLRDAPLEPQEQSVYSDLGFMMLGFVLEAIHEKPLLEIWNDLKSSMYDGTTLEFHPNHQPTQRVSLYAPTEECPWRGRLLQGEVHDENAWALGGVSTHAGLFGSIDDAGWALLNLRSQLLGIGRSPVKMKTARFFTRRARPEGQGDWGLGLMMPTPGAASCGMYFSLTAFGHTGFTGTSLWYDPKADLAVAILSNRVLYGRHNDAFKKLRPEIHNWIVEGLRKASY
ncbi:MAG: serine hydrolase [Bdellovibrionaceae bacterium]|nr:serine hydrolase [Pseudobdellovibrionaceae bacterium]